MARLPSVIVHEPTSKQSRWLQPSVIPVAVAWTVGLVVVISFLAQVHAALGKPLWYDEILTLKVALLRPVSLQWRALYEGVDGMPLAYYLLLAPFTKLSANPHLALRLPSILGYVLAVVCSYLFVQRSSGPIAGLFAAILLAWSPFRYYAVEARAYALVVGLVALAAVLWQRVDSRGWNALLFACALTAATAFHHLAVMVLVCFGIAELVVAVTERRIRWMVWAAMALAVVPILVNLPLLVHYQNIYGRHFWSKPAWSQISTTYGTLAGLQDSTAQQALLILVVVLAAQLLNTYWNWERRLKEPFSLLGELILTMSLLLYPVLLLVVAKIQNAGFHPRYAWPAMLGIVFAAGGLIGRAPVKTARAVTAILLCFFLLHSLKDASGLMHPVSADGAAPYRAALLAITADDPSATAPIVIASGVDFLPLTYYADPALASRFYEIADTGLALRYTQTDTVDRTNLALAAFAPLSLARLEEFLQLHRRFYLYSSRDRFGWLVQYCQDKKFQLRSVWEGQQSTAFLVEMN